MESRNKNSSAKATSRANNGGCITCRVRRKRCDKRMPTCEACERNVLICAYDKSFAGEANISSQVPQDATTILGRSAKPVIHPTTIHKPSCQSCENDTSPTIHYRQHQRHPSIGTPIPLLSLKRRESKFLHDHFLYRTANMLSATDRDQNPFENILLSIAANSDLVLQAVLALSGFHLGCDKSTDLVVATHEHYALAVRGLKYGLTKFVYGQAELALELTVTTLLFCFLECIRGDNDGTSFRHLQAARQLFPAILRERELAAMDPRMSAFLMEYYAYILTLSSCTLAADHPDCYSILNDVQCVFVAMTALEMPAIGMLLGCAHELFALIPSVTLGLGENRPLDETRSETATKHEIRHRVMSWTPNPSTNRDWVTAGRLYQLALLSLLIENEDNFCDTYDVASGSRQEDIYVSSFVGLLKNLSINSKITTTLCWPIAVVGSHARQPEHREAIKQYLQGMEVKYGFGNLTQLRTLLDWCWSKGNSTKALCTENISSVLKSQGITFMLL